MYIDNLQLENYRNYVKEDINFYKGINIIYGNNAQGKTNILEAIYLFATGKSHRTNKDKELIKFNEKYANIKMNFTRRNALNSAQMILSYDQKKRIKINEVPINRIGELMGFFNAVMFSPEDLNLIKEGPSQRRKFLDICISQMKPKYFYDLQQYLKILEQRNKLLKIIETKNSLKDTLQIWDEKLTEYGAKIILYRTTFIKRLKNVAQLIHRDITRGKEQLDIEYLPSVKLYDKNISDVKEIKEIFKRTLENNKEKELYSGITLVGPHRDDLNFIINNLPVKNYGSQGQQRTVVLSVKMAELEFMKEELGEYPILLLDDIMSELDHERQDYIINSIKNKQVIITCTDIENFWSSEDVLFLKVENGTVFKGGNE